MVLLDSKDSKQVHYERNKDLQQQLLQHGLYKATLSNRGIATIKIWQEIVNLARHELAVKENTPEMQQVFERTTDNNLHERS